jgi:hypothetical protein
MLSFFVRPATDGTVTGGSFGAESLRLATVDDVAVVDDAVPTVEEGPAGVELVATGAVPLGTASEPGDCRASLPAAHARAPESANTMIAIGASRFTKLCFISSEE